MSRIAYVNGRYVRHRQATVHVEDRGYQFADGVYEVIAVRGGHLIDRGPHLDRLGRSLGELGIAWPMSRGALSVVLNQCARRNRVDDGIVYLQMSRGVARRDHAIPANPVSSRVVTARNQTMAPEHFEAGIRGVTSSDIRWKRCDIKTVALLPNVLAKQQAAEAGAFEALLVDETGRVTEGSSTSSFRVLDGEIWTTPLGGHILPSITRDALLRAARDLGIAVWEEFSLLEDYLQADEVFLAGTTTESMPVVQIDDTAIGSGAPGPVTMQLRAAFLEMLS